MTPQKIFIDSNYPRGFIEAVECIHGMQREKRFEVVRWSSQSPTPKELKSSVFLLLDRGARSLEVTTVKHFESGYRVVACRMGKGGKKDLFELSMTMLRVWPFIMDKAAELSNPFLYTVKYGGKRLKCHAVK